MNTPQSNTRGERFFHEIEKYLLGNGAYIFLHLFLRRVADRIKSGEIIEIYAPIDAAFERLSTASGKTIEQITSNQEGLDILTNHVSSIPLNLSDDGWPLYIAINGTTFGTQLTDLNLLEPTDNGVLFGRITVTTINKVILGPGQLDRLRGPNLTPIAQQLNTNSSYDALPRDVIRKIALELPLGTIESTCLTSKIFNRFICENEDFWYEKLRKEYPQQTIKIGNNSWKGTYRSQYNSKQLLPRR